VSLRLGAADWSVRPSGRAAWCLDPEVEPALLEAPADLGCLLDWMRSSDRPALLGIDVGLGVPAGHGQGFRAWLADGTTPIQERVAPSAEAWSEARPFFRVPPEPGGLSQFRARGRLTRGLDDAVGAKSPFILSGIPGCVGSSCVQIWEVLRREPGLRIWPFDGSLHQLLAPGEVVLAEIYPSAQLRALCPGRRLRKSRIEDRTEAMGTAQLPLPPDGLMGRTVESEDVFDAWVGLCHLALAAEEGWLEPPGVDPVHEGGLLGGLA